MRSDGCSASDVLENGSAIGQLDDSPLRSNEVARLRAEVKLLRSREAEAMSTIESLQGEVGQLKQQVGAHVPQYIGICPELDADDNNFLYSRGLFSLLTEIPQNPPLIAEQIAKQDKYRNDYRAID